MWRSPTGPKTLSGMHKRLFLEGVRVLRDAAMDGIRYADGAGHPSKSPTYNSLRARRQLICLAEVAQASSNEFFPEPELSAWGEAAIYAVYAELMCVIREVELEGKMGSRVRVMVLRAHREEFGETRRPAGADEWDAMLDELSRVLLWDRDYELECAVRGRDELVGEVFGADDYFAEPPRPAKGDFKRARHALRCLLSDEAEVFDNDPVAVG